MPKRSKTATDSSGRKRRSQKKTPAPSALDNNHLYPPGYTPTSSAADSAANDTRTARPTVPSGEPVITDELTKTARNSTSRVDSESTANRPASLNPTSGKEPLPTTDQTTSASPDNQSVESLLPPGVDTSTPREDPNSSSPSQSIPSPDNPTTSDHLLPPAVSAANESEAATGDNLFMGFDLVDGTGTPSDLDSSLPRMALREPVKVAHKGNQEIELQQSTPEQKLRWKRRKNLVMWIGGILILLITLLVMTY
ncbi:MAG TPA: hypothetical protein EYN03_05290 [Planctomycetes bacterium]|nr:hypothetical protein [Planctomycetota bacterium]